MFVLMKRISTLAACPVGWNWRAGSFFAQTQASICIVELFVCVMCLTAGTGMEKFYKNFGFN